MDRFRLALHYVRRLGIKTGVLHSGPHVKCTPNTSTIDNPEPVSRPDDARFTFAGRSPYQPLRAALSQSITRASHNIVFKPEARARTMSGILGVTPDYVGTPWSS